MPTMRTVVAIAVGAIAGFGAALVWHGYELRPQGPGDATEQVAPPAQGQPNARSPVGRDAVALSEAARERSIAARSLTPSAARRGPSELLEELAGLQLVSGPGAGSARDRILALLEQLAREGPSALPALRQFLASGRDVSYGAAGGPKGPRSVGSLLPRSLRIALFDVVRDIGGPQAEQILVEASAVTGNGVELAALVRLLDELSPGTYRDQALASAKRLLGGGKQVDRADRDAVYEILISNGDTSYVSAARAQLVQPDGTVDASALNYLKHTLGDQALALAATTYQDGRVTDGASKESLARVALAYVGANEEALDLYHRATLDPALNAEQRRNLIEDLNHEGLTSTERPQAADLGIIAERYALAQAYLQQDYVQRDKVLSAAYREAAKDLANMLQRSGRALPAGPPKR